MYRRIAFASILATTKFSSFMPTVPLWIRQTMSSISTWPWRHQPGEPSTSSRRQVKVDVRGIDASHFRTSPGAHPSRSNELRRFFRARLMPVQA